MRDGAASAARVVSGDFAAIAAVGTRVAYVLGVAVVMGESR